MGVKTMASKRVLFVFFMAMLLASTTMVTMIDMAAAPSTLIYVSQELVTGKEPLATFPIDVNVTDAPSTYAWEVRMTWDPNLLELFFKLEGDFLALAGDTTFTTYPATFAEANVKGEIAVGCSLVGDLPLENWAAGDGWLFRLGFRVRAAAYGSTLINLFGTLLLDHIEAGSPAPTPYPNSDSFFYNVSPSHDISGRPSYIKPIDTSVYGGVAKINVTVLNEGTMSESITLNVYANATLIDTTSLQLNGTAGLGGSFENRSRTYTVNWDTTGFALGKYNITATVPAVTGETDTADNSFAGEQWVWVLPGGDINHDGVVDSADLVTLADAYGSTPTSPNWNPFADINDDNKVAVADLFILGKDYGKSV